MSRMTVKELQSIVNNQAATIAALEERLASIEAAGPQELPKDELHKLMKGLGWNTPVAKKLWDNLIATSHQETFFLEFDREYYYENIRICRKFLWKLMELARKDRRYARLERTDGKGYLAISHGGFVS